MAFQKRKYITESPPILLARIYIFEHKVICFVGSFVFLSFLSLFFFPLLASFSSKSTVLKYYIQVYISSHMETSLNEGKISFAVQLYFISSSQFLQHKVGSLISMVSPALCSRFWGCHAMQRCLEMERAQAACNLSAEAIQRRMLFQSTPKKNTTILSTLYRLLLQHSLFFFLICRSGHQFDATYTNREIFHGSMLELYFM